MFGLFKSKESQVKVIDKVWMSTQAKVQACVQMAVISPTTIFIAWFEETRQRFHAALPTSSQVLLARDVTYDAVRDHMVVFLEHHPLSAEEQSVFKRLYLKEAPVLCALDEPFFMKFGGERLTEVMKKIGMKEDEVIGHAMITKSIRRAQEKIASSKYANVSASSMSEWFALNAPNNSRI